MNYRLLTTILSGLAVFFLIMWITKGCDKPTTPPEDTELWREKVAQREGVIKTKDSIIASLQAARTIQRVAYQKDSSRLVRENARLSRGYQKAKDEIAQLLDSIPAVDRFVHASDSLIAVKDSTITVERNHRLADELSYKVEIAALGEKHVQHVAISQEYRNRIDALERKSARLEKRFERKRKFNHVLLGIVGGLAASTTILILTE